jgi:hypothetical protein
MRNDILLILPPSIALEMIIGTRLFKLRSKNFAF